MATYFDIDGHQVAVGTRKVGRKWTWDYTVDGDHYTENREELAPTEDWAIIEARDHATARIRAMK